MGAFIPIIAAVITAVAANDNSRYQANTARDQQKAAADAQAAQNQKMQAQPVDTAMAGDPNAAAAGTPTMPTPDAQAVTQAKQQSIAAQVARRGRASTILTNPNPPSETLG